VETINHPATQEVTNILWNNKIGHRNHQGPQLVSILKHMNAVHTNLSFFSGVHFHIIPTYFHILVVSFLLVVKSKPHKRPSSPHSCYTPHPFHPPSLVHSIYIWPSVQVGKLLAMQLHFSPVRIFPSAAKICIK
jgi:hypothetical protein